MRIGRLFLLALPLRVVAVAVAVELAHEQQQQQQLTFGVTGAQLSSASTRDTPARTDDVPSPSPADIFSHATSLLTTLTAHAPPPPPTTFTPHQAAPAAHEPLLDALESSLGPIGASLVRSLRRAVRFLFGGAGGQKRGRDWSVRGTVLRLRALLKVLFGSPAVEQRKPGAPKTTSTGGRITRWTDGLFGPGVLPDDQVREGMDEVVRLANEAANRGVPEAWLLLGDLYLTGHLSLPADPQLALEAYTKASEQSGLPEAQYKLGFLYGSNYGAATTGVEGEGKQGSALLHYTFAALSSHAPASMTVGYRHWVGIGTKQSCKDALGWYKAAADQAMRTFNAGPPGGRLLPPPKIRLSDLKGGAYGPGASASSRPHSTGGSNSQTQQEWDDLLEFHHFHAERGDPKFMFMLGRLYYQGFGGGGTGGVRGGQARLSVASGGLSDGLWDGGRDFNRASKWFMRVARGVWQKDVKEATTAPGAPAPRKGEPPKVGFYDATKDLKTKMDDHFSMVAGLAAGYLGRMYMRGEGSRVDYAKAFLWFMRGAGQGDRESNNGLGVMYRDGLGVERDLKKANLLFLAAAQQDLAEAQVNLGKYHFGIGDFVLATTYFEHAIKHDGVRQADTFQSYYYLAELSSRAINRADQCPVSVSFYKVVAERGDWDHEVWWEAERALGRGDERLALLGYWIMAERGYEAAQNNVAWILDRDKMRLRLPVLDDAPASNLTDRLALAYWTRSAAQDNVDALVKMGDYYFKGLGVEAEGVQLERAAACYQSAATARTSAMAMWNLGWMHEHGKGVTQDFHLAKRYYDLALETSADAYLPATLSLISLYARSLYNAVFGTDEDLKSLSLFSSPPLDENATPAQSWSLGRAWRETQRRWGLDPGPEGAANDDVGGGEIAEDAYAAAERAGEIADAQRALEANYDGIEWARRARDGIHDDEDDDDFMIMDGEGDLTGTVAIVVLCVILGWLLYFRQGRFPEQQQQQQAHQQPPAPVPGAAPAPPAPDARAQGPAPTPPPLPPDADDEDDPAAA